MELPIYDNPPLKAYQGRAFELSILMAHYSQNIMPWLINKHINCVYNSQNQRVPFDTVMYDDRWYNKEKLFKVQRIRLTPKVLEMKLFDFVEFTKEMLRNQNYLWGYFDEYHIPGKFPYQKFHYRHDILIYGYDDNERSFLALGYTENRKYEKYTITYENFQKSINVGYNEKETNLFAERLEFDYARLNESLCFKVNIKEIYSNLYDYLHSINSYGSRNYQLTYGVESYRAFAYYVKESREYLDDRIGRFFMEIKILMLERIKYLEQNGYLSTGYSEEYEVVSKTQSIVHLLFLKYNLTLDHKIIDSIVEKQNFILEKELEILTPILEELRLYLLKKDKI